MTPMLRLLSQFVFAITAFCVVAQAGPVTTTPGSYAAPLIASDGAHGSYIVWNDDDAQAVYIQHLKRNGTPFDGWPAGGIRVCNNPGAQRQPTLVADESSVIVAWSDGRGADWDIYAQRFTAAGQPQWGSAGLAVCTAQLDQTQPAITSDLAGGCYLAWTDVRHFPGGTAIYGQWLTSAGVPGTYNGVQWAANGTRFAEAPFGSGYKDPRIAFWPGASGPVVTWAYHPCHPLDGTCGAWVVLVNFISRAGAPVLGNGLQVSTQPTDEQKYADILPTAGSDAIVVFESRNTSGIPYGWGIWAQRVTSAGQRLWGQGWGIPIVDTFGDQTNNWLSGPYAISHPSSGTFITTWQDDRDFNGAFVVYAQAMDFNGNALWSAANTLISPDSPCYNAWYPKLCSDGAGGAIVTWVEYDNGCGMSPCVPIRTARVAASGAHLWNASFWSACTAPNLPAVCADGWGGAFGTWQDTHPSQRSIREDWATNGGLVGPSITAPAAVSDLAVVDCTWHSISLAWTTGADGAGMPLASYEIRYSLSPITEANWGSALLGASVAAAGQGATQSVVITGLQSCTNYYLGVKARDVDGTMSGVSNIVFEPTPCSQYSICEGGFAIGGVPEAPEVTVPSSLAFAAMWPVPARNALQYEYDVPRWAEGKQLDLGVFDIAGRRVVRLVGPTAAGRHKGAWDLRDSEGRRVRAGLYWMRLVVEQKSVVKCVVVE